MRAPVADCGLRTRLADADGGLPVRTVTIRCVIRLSDVGSQEQAARTPFSSPPWRVVYGRRGTPHSISTRTAKYARLGYSLGDDFEDDGLETQFAGRVFLDLLPADLTKAVDAGVLTEVHCVQ